MTETDTPRTDWARQISPQAVILEAEKLERENAELRAELLKTLDYLIAWRADASKCRNQDLVIDRLKALLGYDETRDGELRKNR